MTQETITMPVATEHKHYELGGDHEGWWRKVSKSDAMGTLKASAVKAEYGNESLGWFVPVDLVGDSDKAAA